MTTKLAGLIAVITGAALAAMFFFVVPQLESNLRGQKERDLQRVAAQSRTALQSLMGRRDIPAAELDRRVRAVADVTDARVTLLGVQQSGSAPGVGAEEPRFYVISDSREGTGEVPVNARLAGRAVRSDAIARGDMRVDGEQLGQVAQPLSYRERIDWVAVYSRSFEDVEETVAFIRRRILVASAIAMLIALAGGYLVARALARRVRRLEEGAEAVAAGNFIEPLPVESDDELGQLTRTFNTMQHQLRRVDVTRKEFVATASHELRTPIFSLGGFVELLRDEDLDEETRREFLDTMAEQVERLQKLAVDLLDLSRLDAGSVELQTEDVDLGELTSAVAREFTPAAARHRSRLDVRVRDGEVTAHCDAERVAQILRILLDNALTHTPEGTAVTVTARRVNGTAQLTVTDAGRGLPDETKVFERFYTGDATRGAGLGLAIARELAERMGGAIGAEPHPAGAALRLVLPAEQGEPG